MGANAGAIRAGRANIEIGVDKRPLTQGLKTSAADLKQWGNRIIGVGATLAGLGAAIRGPILAATAVFAQAGSAALDISQRTGLATEAVSRLGFMARQTGAGIEDVENGVKKMQKFLSEAFSGDSESILYLSKLGLKMEEIKKLKPEEQFGEIAKKIGALPTATERTAAALKIFGKGGTALIPLMMDFSALELRAKRLGLGMSREAAESAHRMGDALEDLTTISKGLTSTIGAALAPAMTDWFAWATLGVKIAKDWVKANQAFVVTASTVGAVLLGIGSTVIGLGLAVRTAGFALAALLPPVVAVRSVFQVLGGLVSLAFAGIGASLAPVGAALSALWGVLTMSLSSVGAALAGVGASIGAFLISPIGLAILAVGGLVGAFYLFGGTTQQIFDAVSGGFQSVRSGVGSVTQSILGVFGPALSSTANLFGTLKTTAIDTFGGIAAALQTGNIPLATEILWAGISVAWEQGVAGLRGLWADFSAALQISWVNTSTLVSEVWAQLVANISGAWQTVVDWITSALTRIGNLLGLVSKETMKTIEENQARSAAATEKSQRAASDQRQQSAINQVASIRAGAEQAKQTNPASQERLAGLIGKLASLNAQAASEAAAKTLASKSTAIDAANAGVAEDQSKKKMETSIGGFSAFAIGQQDGGFASQTATNTKLTAKYTKQIASRKGLPGPTYA